MEKSNELEVFIGWIGGRYSASIQKFHRFQISDNRILDLFTNLKSAIHDHMMFCRISKYSYPEVLRGEYGIKYKYSIYAALALMPDLFLLSKETKITYAHLREYVAYTRKPSGLTFKKVFEGINRIGEKISALEKPDFALCSNEELIAEYSGIPLEDVQAYKSKKVNPKIETQEKLLAAMHQIGQLYQSLTWE